MTTAPATHQSLQRAVAILRVFSESEPTMTVGDISRRTGVHKSTVSRILATLLAEGLVWHDETTGRYSLGLGLVELAGVALGQIDVRTAAMPHMESLAMEVDETVVLSVLRGSEAVTVAHVAPSHSVRHVVWIGRRSPLRSTAAGKVFLAAHRATGQDWRTLGLPAEVNVGSAGDEPDMAAELDAISRDGIATEVDEFEVGTSALAAPVQDATGAVVAAIAIGGPTDRFDADARRRAVGRLSATADDIAWELGLRVEAAG